MLEYISSYPVPHTDEINERFIRGDDDTSIVDYIIIAMKEFEAISNVTIEKIEVVDQPDEIELDTHMININFKKKNLDLENIPHYKLVGDSLFGEVVFTIRVATNLSEKTIVKRILYPIELAPNVYLNGGRKMTAIYQLVDASVYSQRGRITLKSRMPIIIYCNDKRIITDVYGEAFVTTSYSYALESKQRSGPMGAQKKRTKFINPLYIYIAKIGFRKTLEFFGVDKIVSVVSELKENDTKNLYFPVNELFIKVPRKYFEKYPMVQSFVSMASSLGNKEFPVTFDMLENAEYWTCRIGYVGAAKNKNLYSFFEKGNTTLFMVERLLDTVTSNNLRLPRLYRQNIYFLMYWMMTNYREIRRVSNIDMANKRARRNEYIVLSSLGRKISENIHKLIEKKSKSKLNTLPTLLECFNFNSDIIISGMRNLNDLIKTDEISNDNTLLLSVAYGAKGYQSLGESSKRLISNKYRLLDTSMIGVLDCTVTSTSEPGLSGAFSAFVETYDGFYFDPNREYCKNRYFFDKMRTEEDKAKVPFRTDTFEHYIEDVEKCHWFEEEFKPFPITITEKEI